VVADVFLPGNIFLVAQSLFVDVVTHEKTSLILQVATLLYYKSKLDAISFPGSMVE
jgi:hypothetical protein